MLVSQFWGLWFLHSGQISQSNFFCLVGFFYKWLNKLVKYISPHFKVFLELAVFIALPACAERLGNNMKPSLLGFHDNVVLGTNCTTLNNFCYTKVSVLCKTSGNKEIKGYICHWDYKNRRGSELIIFQILQKKNI